MLYLICEALETTIPEVFEELYSSKGKRSRAVKMLESPEVVKLAGLFFGMSPGDSERFMGLGKKLVEEG